MLTNIANFEQMAPDENYPSIFIKSENNTFFMLNSTEQEVQTADIKTIKIKTYEPHHKKISHGVFRLVQNKSGCTAPEDD